jgi:hypothetical protein
MRPRFGIAALMGAVLFAALGLTALHSPSDLWASATFTATVTLLSASVLGAMASRGRSRVTWAGLAVFGWVYLGIVFGPWPRNLDGPPPLLTVPLLDAVKDYVVSDGKTPYLTLDHPGRHGVEIALVGKKGPGVAPPGGYKVVALVAYRQVGHSLGAALFGLIGAAVGRSLAARAGAGGEG